MRHRGDQALKKILDQVQREARPMLGRGRVADYIPELAQVRGDHFGMAVVTMDGQTHSCGDALEAFSIQSISKLFSLTLAFSLVGDALWQRVGREPSGTAFNSLVQLEHEHGRPRNPFINAGALIVTDILCTRFVQPEMALVDFLRRLCGNPQIQYDERVARAYRVGIPAKSGVGGGIVAHIPRRLGVCTWSPELDACGNSLAGGFALERLTTLCGQSVF